MVQTVEAKRTFCFFSDGKILLLGFLKGKRKENFKA
jgi:uncharacterized protein VirK/YbjX